MQIITCVVISISIIFSIHYSYYYIKDNYMFKKSRCLVNDIQSDKYNKMLEEIKQIRLGSIGGSIGGSMGSSMDGDSIDNRIERVSVEKNAMSGSPTSPFKDEKEKDEMNDELTQFINNQFILPISAPSIPSTSTSSISSVSPSTTQFTI